MVGVLSSSSNVVPRDPGIRGSPSQKHPLIKGFSPGTLSLRTFTPLQYKVKKNTGFGRLTKSNALVDLADLEVFADPQEYSSLPETNNKFALQCLGYDLENGAIAFERFDWPLRPYLDSLGVPSKEYVLPGKVAPFWYTPDPFRTVIKRIIKFVACQHSIRESVFSLTIDDNMVMKDNKVRFWQYKVRPLTVENQKADLLCIKAIIEELFLGYTMPLDIFDLTEKLKSIHSIGLLPHHLSLLSSKKRRNFFTRIHEHQKTLKPKIRTKFENALSRCGPWNGWTRPLKNISRGPIFTTFMYHKSAKNPYVDTGTANKVNHSLIMCCRHMNTHLPDNIQGQVHDHDVDMMVWSLFHYDLLELQEELYKSEILSHFM